MTEEARSMGELFQRLSDANVLHHKGNIPAALIAFRSILNDWPDQPDALHMLAVIAQQLGNYNLALQLFDETVRHVPHFGTAWINRAILLRFLDRHEEALASTNEALKAEPKHGGGWAMKAILLRDERRYQEALEHHKKAVELNPKDANILSQYATGLLATGDLKAAWHWASEAEKNDPHRSEVLQSLGAVLMAAGYPSRALDYFSKAQIANPRNTDAFIEAGNAHLLMGNFEEGWPLMEKRKLYLHDPRCETLPRWTGESINHLLIAAEQGAGDNIQSLRYIDFAKARAQHITLQMPEALQGFVKSNFPDIKIITPNDPLPDADAFIPIMSLAHYYSLSNEVIPEPRLLKTKSDLRKKWQGRLKSLAFPRIGFVWAGNPMQRNDHNRSVPWDCMKHLIEAAGAHAVCLQKGGSHYNLAGLSAYDAAKEIEDFEDGAALMNELDLLITADTAPAHFMGSFKKPVWVMLPFDPGWRYMLGREDSVWYPTMRLFRQKKWAEWPAVLDDVGREMEKYLAGDEAVLKPSLGQPQFQNPYAIKIFN